MNDIDMEYTGGTMNIITAVVRNHSGVLSRIAGLFARRGYNIESLAVSVTDDADISRMTIVTCDGPQVVEQICKQLNKQIDVLRVVYYPSGTAAERELALIKVSAEPGMRSEILQIVSIFRASVIDICESDLLIELTGGHAKVDAFAEQISRYGIREMARTGVNAMARGHAIA